MYSRFMAVHASRLSLCCLQCKAGVQTARKQIEDVIGAHPGEAFFAFETRLLQVTLVPPPIRSHLLKTVGLEVIIGLSMVLGQAK